MSILTLGSKKGKKENFQSKRKQKEKKGNSQSKSGRKQKEKKGNSQSKSGRKQKEKKENSQPKNGKKKGEVLSIAEKKKEGKILKKTATKIEFKWGAELNVRKSWINRK